jgi:RNA polymerase sigma factor (sigma-70 family)
METVLLRDLIAGDWDTPALIKAGADRDQAAWDELVRRHAGLINRVIRHYRLSTADTEDVTQTVWLRLVESLDGIRVPAALPGWLATTTQRECLRCLRLAARGPVAHPVEPVTDPKFDEIVLAAERRHALRAAVAELPPHQRRLVTLLAADPPYSYAEISRILDIPIGSIGPTRARILTGLRATAALRPYLEPA